VDGFQRIGRHVVLEFFQLGRQVSANQIGSRAEDLPSLMKVGPNSVSARRIRSCPVNRASEAPSRD